MTKPFLSLIICTRNRGFRLPQLFESLQNLAYPKDRWELLLVNNASTDGTDQILTEYSSKVPTKATVLNEPKIGLSHARNLGISKAMGDVFIFTDDDCLPKFDFLEKIESSFRTNTIDFLSGKILLKDPGDAQITISTGNNPQFLEPRKFIPAGLIKGANMAFKREVFDAIGKFDERLGLGTSFPAEDVDFAMRASLTGFRGAYLPDPVVFHDHGRKPGTVEFFNAQKGYDFGRGAYFVKHLLSRDSFKIVLTAYAKHLFRNINFRTLLRSYRELVGAVGYTIIKLTKSSNINRLPP